MRINSFFTYLSIKRVAPWALILIFFSAAAFRGSERYSSVNDNAFEIAKNLEILGKILQEINANYVDDIEPNQFMRTGIDAMLKSLDPFTNFISASEIEDYQYLSTGQYGGIGATLDKFEDKIVISEVYADRPADKAGIKAGDEILQIDEEVINGKKFDHIDVRNLVRGQPGTSIRIKVRRYGVESPITLNVQREDIKVDNVPYYGVIQDKIGYVALKQFTKDATQEVKKAIEELKAKEPELKGLILDLRGNPGGLLYEAVGISNLFINQGEKIVETRGKMEGSYKRYDATNPPLDTRLPLTLLIDASSASASEIVSGVMQDLDRGVVLGRRSYGKGLVQTTRPLSYKTQIKLTTARYYTSSGRCIQAINYANKDKSGAVQRTADADKSLYKTRNGRPVLDQGGIEPDIKVDEPELHKITKDLLTKRLIFAFATEFYYKNPSIPPAKDFIITDDIYNQFIDFTQRNKFEYESRFTREVESLRKNLETEAYFTAIEPKLNDLKKELEVQCRNDIKTQRKEISSWLRTEIASRYYSRAGRIESSFQDDPDIVQAVALLNDQQRYNNILKGKK